MTNLLTHYHTLCESGKLSHDPAQADIFSALDALTTQLIAEEKKRHRLFARFRKKNTVRGLYLHGKVGAGKSFMMDTFYEALPIQSKKRVHFHEFMKTLQQELKQHEGQVNPIKHIIKSWTTHLSVLCFDEFVVTDIAEAMLLSRVFSALIENGVCVIATANVAPDDLYRDGLQRISFLPTIALIKKHMTVLACLSAEDYRLRYLKNAGTYHTPLNEASNLILDKTFAVLTHHSECTTEAITLCDRPVPIKKMAGDCIWFDFHVLCHPPRSQLDYLALADQFKTVFVSDIPVIHAKQHNTILLFIRLIDVLYNARIRIVCSAEKPPAMLYPEGRFAFEYQRTCSRLIEMQSENYVEGRA